MTHTLTLYALAALAFLAVCVALLILAVVIASARQDHLAKLAQRDRESREDQSNHNGAIIP